MKFLMNHMVDQIEKHNFNCTFDSRVKPFLDFKNNKNKSILIYCDKFPSLAYILKADYESELTDLFDNEKYLKIHNFKIVTKLDAFQLLIRETLQNNFFTISLIKLATFNNIGYVTLK
jgi:hypothetical protein